MNYTLLSVVYCFALFAVAVMYQVRANGVVYQKGATDQYHAMFNGYQSRCVVAMCGPMAWVVAVYATQLGYYLTR